MSVASTSAPTPPFDYALIGNLRPWELDDFARKVVDQDTARLFVSGLHDRLVRQIDRWPTPSEIEHIVRIAAEAYEILGDHRNVLSDVKDGGIVWSIFAKAMKGTNIVELEDFASRQAEESKATAASIEAATKVIKSYIAKNRKKTANSSAAFERFHSDVINKKLKREFNKFSHGKRKPTTAQIKESIRPEGLISFIDGKAYKALTYHILAHGLDPAEYRKRFNLPPNYPMTAKAASRKWETVNRTVEKRKPAIVRHRSGKQAGSA